METLPSLAVEKPKTSQVFSEEIKIPNQIWQISGLKPESRKQTFSAKPRNIESREPPQGKVFAEDFRPYGIQDYQAIKSEKYYQLGGLGPVNIGTDDWNLKKELQEKKMSYAKRVNSANSNLPPRKPAESVKEISKAEKSKNFAKNIPKPKTQTRSKEPQIIPSALDELEKQHTLYKQSVEAIRNEYSM